MPEYVDVLIYLHRSSIHRQTWFGCLHQGEIGQVMVAGPLGTCQRFVENLIRSENEYVDTFEWVRFGSDTLSVRVSFRDA